MKFLIIVLSFLFWSCNTKQSYRPYKFKNEIVLKNIKPIGVALLNDTLWLSDSDGNRLVQINKKGEVLREVEGFDRPMHIASAGKSLLIPEYGNDRITLFKGSSTTVLETPDLDAPAGIHSFVKEKAIADFYHHKVHFFNGENWASFGGKGNVLGQFHYPTDVQITKDEIFVADAYNHRIQVFDKNGNVIKVIGEASQMNATTGIFISESHIYATDFENNRILIFNKEGEVIQDIKKNLSKPVDIILFRKQLIVLNFDKGTLSVFEK